MLKKYLNKTIEKTIIIGKAYVTFGGLLKPIPQSLLKGAADSLVKQVLDCIKKKCETD